MRNKTRKSKQKGGEDFSGQNFTERNFSRQNLADKNFKESTLVRANFTEAILHRANFTRAILTGAILTGANLTDAILRGANFFKADLTRAILNEANLIGSILIEAILRGANLTGSNLIEANLTKAYLTKANLTKAHLWVANLNEADLTEADLTGADLSDANLTNANLTGAILKGAILKGAILRGAIFNYAKMDGVIGLKISNKTNFSKINILNDKSKSKKNLAHIVSLFRKTKIYKPLIKKIYDGILNDSIQIDNNKIKKIENILSNTVINSIVNNNKDFIPILNDKELLKKNVKTYTPEEINRIITTFYKNKIYKKKLEVLLSRTNLSNEEKLLIKAITNKTNIIPTLITDKSIYNSVYYDPIIGQYIFIIPAGTLFFRGSNKEKEEENIPECLYTYSVPTMCFGVAGFNYRYNTIYVVKAIKDLKFIISILPAPKSRHNLRTDKLIFSNNERNKNVSELQGNILYSVANDPSLHKDIRKYSNIDGIISISGMDSFYDGYRKELKSMSDWLKRSVQLGVPTKYYISHMNIDSSSNIGYPEYVIYSDKNDSKNKANTKIEYIMTISSDEQKGSNESIIELCQKLFEYLSDTRRRDLYWDKRTGNFFDSKDYNKDKKYFTKYDTDLTLKDVLLEIDGDITTILNNSNPLEGTLTKIQYITKDLCDKINEIITTHTNSSVLSRININNKKFKFPNRTNSSNFSGGQKLMTLSMIVAYARYLIPIPYSLFFEQNIEEDFL